MIQFKVFYLSADRLACSERRILRLSYGTPTLFLSDKISITSQPGTALRMGSQSTIFQNSKLRFCPNISNTKNILPLQDRISYSLFGIHLYVDQAQLNMYGFHKQRHPTSDNYFQHESFRRGQDLLQIKRKPEKKKKGEEDNGVNSQQEIMKQNSSEQNPEMGPKQFTSPLKQTAKVMENVGESRNQIIFNQMAQNDSAQLQSMSLHGLCEQTIRQNQSLTSLHSHIMSTALAIKKFKLKMLRNQVEQTNQGIQETLFALQKMVRAETDKMSLFIDFLSF